MIDQRSELVFRPERRFSADKERTIHAISRTPMPCMPSQALCVLHHHSGYLLLGMF
jgi:hypothetical protein